ncbi:MAG: DUF5028 domain-containing protein [Lachnospiraceae bacterium]|nr:DUF5028 domain-containing protein [Lachnospiraceae bacterium]
MKKAIKGSIVLLLIILYSVRMISINKATNSSKTITYEYGAEVPFENDFYDDITDNPHGYSISVVDNRIMDRESFLSFYNVCEDDIPEMYSFIYLVKTRIRNNNENVSQQYGINLSRFALQDEEFMTYSYRSLIPEINGLNTFSFSLMPNTEVELLIPFCINTEYTTRKHLENGNAVLVITLYPNKKCLSLNNDD